MSLFVVRERKVDELGGVGRLGHAMVNMLDKSQRFFVAVDKS